MSTATTVKNNQPTQGTMTIRHIKKGNEPLLLNRAEPARISPAITTQLQELLQLLGPDKPAEPTYKSRFLIRKGHQFLSLPVTDIRYFYSKEKLCFVKTHDNKDYVMPFNITEIEEMVNPAQFFRASRKYIISHSAITRILVWFNGKLKVEIQPGGVEEIVISRERVNNFKTWLGE